MNEGTLGSSLRQLTRLLEKHYETKVIVLIDEYDVPLAKAATKRDIERLIAGEVITKEIHQELTYAEIYQTIDNISGACFLPQVI